MLPQPHGGCLLAYARRGRVFHKARREAGPECPDFCRWATRLHLVACQFAGHVVSQLHSCTRNPVNSELCTLPQGAAPALP